MIRIPHVAALYGRIPVSGVSRVGILAKRFGIFY